MSEQMSLNASMSIKPRISCIISTYGDLDFWSRAAHEGIRAKLIRKVLYLYTTAPSQLSKSHNKKKELADAAGKSGGLRWYPKVANAMIFHRRVFRLFPSIYLIDGNIQ